MLLFVPVVSHASSRVARGLVDPDDEEAPDASLFIGTLMSVSPHGENKLPRNWKKFAEEHPSHAHKLRKAASRFVMLDGSSQFQLDLAPDTAKVKKYLMFREMLDEEQREMEDKSGQPGQAKKARRSRAKAKTQPQAETSEGNGDGAEDDTNIDGEDQDTDTHNQDADDNDNGNDNGGDDGDKLSSPSSAIACCVRCRVEWPRWVKFGPGQ